MPFAPRKPCKTVGCGSLRPCPKHPEPTRWSNRVRGLYPDAAWKRLRAQILARDGYRCVLCGGTARLSVDHITARADGGTDDPTNLRTLDAKCHDRKSGQEGQARR